jgi:hypothetical protein
MAEPPPVTLDDMIAEVRRECQRRREVYWVAAARGAMNRRSADRRIDVMDAVLDHLEKERANDRGTVD